MKTKLLLFFGAFFFSTAYSQVAPYPDMSYDEFLCEDELYKTQTICLNERANEEMLTATSLSTCGYVESVLPAYNNVHDPVPPPLAATCNGICCFYGQEVIDATINITSYYIINLICTNNPLGVSITKVNTNCWNVNYLEQGTFQFNLEINVRYGREIGGFYCQDTTFYNSCGEDRIWKQFSVQVGNQYPCNNYIESPCNLIQNGGFEDMINCPMDDPNQLDHFLRDQNFAYLENWHELANLQEPYFFSTCGDFFGEQNSISQYRNYPQQPLPSGDNYLFLKNSNMKFGQFQDLCPNQKYTLSFFGVKGRGNYNSNTLNLSFNGLNIPSFPTTNNGINLTNINVNNISFDWNFYSSNFTSPSAFNAISISGNQIMIDNLSLIPVDTLTYTFTQNAIDCDSGNLILNIPGCYGPYDVSMIVNNDSLNFYQVMDGHTIQIPLSSANNTVTVESITNSTGCTTILGVTDNIIIPNPGNASFTSSNFCFGESNTIQFFGDQGEFNLVNDTTGAFIHPSTGILSNVTPNVNYIIEHTVCLDHQYDTIMAILHDASFVSSDICDGGINSVLITGELNGTFSLLPPTFGAQINATNGILSGTTSGNSYEIQYIVGTQCADTTSVIIQVNSIDDPSFITSDFCYNETNQVTVTGTSGGTFQLVNSTDQTVIDSNTGELNNFNSGNTYTIQYVTNGACPDSSTQTVNVIPLPTVTLSGTSGDLCVNDSLPLQFNFTGTAPWSIVLSNSGTNSTLSNIANNHFTHFIHEFGTYTVVSVTDGFCTNVGDTLNSIEITGDSIVLFANLQNGCSPLEVSFWSNVTNQPFDCVWNFGDGSTLVDCDTVTHIFNESGNYYVQLTVSSPQCATSAFLQSAIEVYSDPIAAFAIDPTNPSIMHNSVQTSNQSLDAINSTWMLNQSIVSLDNEPLLTFPAVIQENELCLIVESSNHCFDTTCKTIFVQDASLIYLPNAFIPDNDGLNDVFKAEGSNLVYFELQIFNRWGEKIFESKDITNGWDGTYNGNKAAIGVYSYRLLYRFTGEQGNHLINGHVTLIE